MLSAPGPELVLSRGDQRKGLRVLGEIGKPEFVFKDPEISLGTARKSVSVFKTLQHAPDIPEPKKPKALRPQSQLALRSRASIPKPF